MQTVKVAVVMALAAGTRRRRCRPRRAAAWADRRQGRYDRWHTLGQEPVGIRYRVRPGSAEPLSGLAIGCAARHGHADRRNPRERAPSSLI